MEGRHYRCKTVHKFLKVDKEDRNRARSLVVNDLHQKPKVPCSDPPATSYVQR